uniref:PiggyBac transposable element-derived protein domain-containing protein n=1 Tax=Vespula pensylvanica TaxID=30213 RepID=A0A834N3I6_VESPE|nr:hypothetical protein H0235_017085 [Vespula pensylvanica]
MFSRKLKLNFEIFSLNSLCFPSGQEKYDPCAKFVRHANRNFKLHYAPYQELSIDESLIGTLCHFSIIQYLPNKKHHRWVKFWMLCNAVSKYCLIFYSYKGAEVKTDSDGRKFGLGYNVVSSAIELHSVGRKSIKSRDAGALLRNLDFFRSPSLVGSNNYKTKFGDSGGIRETEYQTIEQAKTNPNRLITRKRAAVLGNSPVELNSIHMDQDEYILDFTDRMKYLYQAICDEERYGTYELTENKRNEIDEFTLISSFCDVLSLKHSIKINPNTCENLLDAFAKARQFYTRIEQDRIRC